jgi:hypothetical protein
MESDRMIRCFGHVCGWLPEQLKESQEPLLNRLEAIRQASPSASPQKMIKKTRSTNCSTLNASEKLLDERGCGSCQKGPFLLPFPL